MSGTPRIAPGGMVFHVLNRGNAGARIFDHDGDYAAFERVIADVLPLAPMRVLAYCFMPSHWHFVVWPELDGQLAAFVQRLTVTHVRRWHGHRGSTGKGHLYQGTYKSFAVQSDEHFLRVCRYVERNPLRAGLVARAEDWRWGSLWQRQNAGEEAKKLLTPWPLDMPEDYAEWVNVPQTAEEVEALRACIHRGRPYGDGPWQAEAVLRLGLPAEVRRRGRPHKINRT